MNRSVASRALLAVAAIAVGFAATDTYIVVMAMPDMMTAAGLPVQQLQKAAPILSGFLLGYVTALPLIGRISDLRGRLPVIVGSLAIFAVGSLVTAAAYDLHSMIAGRLLQGIGGGGLIPPTLALVAELWPADRRGVPLGIVGAVQELGSVLGPLLGAAVLAVGDWRGIFWLNAAIGALLAAAALGSIRSAAKARINPRRALLGGTGLLGFGAVLLVMLAPARLTSDVTLGLAFLPAWGDSQWASPLAFVAYAGCAVTTALVDWRAWRSLSHAIDLAGAAGLAVALGAVIVAFASSDPERSTLSPGAGWLFALAIAGTAVFGWRQRTAHNPLIPRGALHRRPAWGALAVSFFIGAALIAALVDIPFFARLTAYPDSQLDAALVLLRFLVALPLGAIVGGWLLARVPAPVITAAGMLMSAAAFSQMAQWHRDALDSASVTWVLVAAGLGFGLAIAPVNAALLEHTDDEVHGVASGLLIVARMGGMLVGISALTSLGLHAFNSAVASIDPHDPHYTSRVIDAGVRQLDTVFAGAAVCALIAATLAAILLRSDAADR